MYKIYSWFKYHILFQRSIDPSRFICTTEEFLFSDLLHLEGNCTITHYDTAVSLNSLLNIPLSELPYSVRYNRTLLYRELYKHLYDLCEWDKLSVNTGGIPLIKTVVKRLRHHL